MRTLVRLLARVRMAVDLEARGPREGLVARAADVAVLRLRVRRLRAGGDVVVVLPGVAGGEGGRRLRRELRGRVHGVVLVVVRVVRGLLGREVGGEGPLGVDPGGGVVRV